MSTEKKPIIFLDPKSALLEPEWRVMLDHEVLPTSWNSRGAALAGAQVELRRRGVVSPVPPSMKELLAALKSALRYIEVRTAYTGAMTASEVEAAILDEHFPSRIEIGANSCNTLATFDVAGVRELVRRAEEEKL